MIRTVCTTTLKVAYHSDSTTKCAHPCNSKAVQMMQHHYGSVVLVPLHDNEANGGAVGLEIVRRVH